MCKEILFRLQMEKFGVNVPVDKIDIGNKAKDEALKIKRGLFPRE